MEWSSHQVGGHCRGLSTKFGLVQQAHLTKRGKKHPSYILLWLTGVVVVRCFVVVATPLIVGVCVRIHERSGGAEQGRESSWGAEDNNIVIGEEETSNLLLTK